MAAVREAPSPEVVESVDQRVVLHGATWQDFERILAIRGDRAAPRVTYRNGDLELMSPSRTHEILKGTIGRLVEAHAEERGVEIVSAGSWTLRHEPRESAAEPDECYIVGDPAERVAPDLAIEVVWTSGGIDKLEIYREIGVGEVWFWREGKLEVFLLRAGSYKRSKKSVVLPDLDLDQMARFVTRSDQTQAVREYRQSLRRR